MQEPPDKQELEALNNLLKDFDVNSVEPNSPIRSQISSSLTDFAQPNIQEEVENRRNVHASLQELGGIQRKVESVQARNESSNVRIKITEPSYSRDDPTENMVRRDSYEENRGDLNGYGEHSADLNSFGEPRTRRDGYGQPIQATVTTVVPRPATGQTYTSTVVYRRPGFAARAPPPPPAYDQIMRARQTRSGPNTNHARYASSISLPYPSNTLDRQASNWSMNSDFGGAKAPCEQCGRFLVESPRKFCQNCQSEYL